MPEEEKENPPFVAVLADDTKRGADDAAALPARLGRYSEARQRSLQMAHFTRQQGYVKEANKLDSCGEYLLFRHYFTVDKVRLHAAQFCKKHLLCPLCAIRRGAKALKAYLDRFELIRQDEPHLVPYLVTLTVKNGPDLAERFKHLRRSVQRLHKYRHLERGHQVCKAMGAVWSYEVTNRGNGWHPHMHAIWLCGSVPDQVALGQEWARITGDSFIVDVRPIQGDPVDGFCEVFKYAVKFSELELADNLHAYDVLSGQRLVASFGAFYGIEIPDELTDEGLDDLPYIDLLYRYLRGVGYSFVPPQEAAA